MFSEYHEGFRRQVEVWPSNPVDGYIRDIKLRARARFPNARGGGRPGGAPSKPDGPQPLPRTDGTCYVADLGCGDARLASTLEPESKKLKLKIMSYDLHSPAKHVTKADIANLPLENDSVDVAIFCLALMGTNWLDFIEEAYRILHWKGELWIAEIKSRFGPVHRKNAVVSHSVGNRKKAAAAAAGKKTKEPEETEEDRTALAVEVDGHEDKRGETDVSAFVEALRKRGFVLAGQGEGNKGAVDLSNKMFVKMHFIKGAVPTKGKGLVAAKAAGYVDKEKKQKRFVWETEEDKVDETGILKPCVYKIR
ncbi:ribosomal RNA-processing protein [Colletotrichum lupini]|nr:ribosomal RNA-processing protein [Colletotrichum lupini]